MSRRARTASGGPGENHLPIGLPEVVIPVDRAAALIATLARRAATWGWLDVHERVRCGEPVRAFLRGMMELTLARRSGRGRPPPEFEWFPELEDGS